MDRLGTSKNESSPKNQVLYEIGVHNFGEVSFFWDAQSVPSFHATSVKRLYNHKKLQYEIKIIKKFSSS